MPRRSTPHPFFTKVGTRIFDLRLEQDKTLADVADAVMFSKGHLSSIERGFCAITIETVERIAQGLGVRPMDLLVFKEEHERDKIADLVRRLPERELPKLRKELEKRLAGSPR